MAGEAVKPGAFWYGPIVDQRQAGRIVAWAAWPAIALPVFGAVAGLSNDYTSISRSAGDLAAVVIFTIPAIFLLTRKSRIAAIWLFGLAALITTATIVVGVFLSIQGTGPVEGISILSIAAIYVAYVIVLWRSVLAARAWQRLSASQSSG